MLQPLRCVHLLKTTHYVHGKNKTAKMNHNVVGKSIKKGIAKSKKEKKRDKDLSRASPRSLVQSRHAKVAPMRPGTPHP